MSNNERGNKENWANQTLSKMTLEEKIGQLFIVTAISDPDLLDPQHESFFDFAAKHAGLDCKWNEYGNPTYIESLLKEYNVGGVLYLGKARASSQIRLTNRFRTISKYPLFIAQDCEWGLNHRLTEAIKFPQSMTLGALSDNTLIYEMGREIGKQCLSLGININFAPCVDVNVDYQNPVINMRSYGEDKIKVASKAIMYMKGMQDVGLITCAKHFPGHGDTHVDSHYDLPRIDKTVAELHNVELYPFKKMIEGNVDSIMTAHLEVPALENQPKLPSSLSYSIVTDLLRKEMGFKGLIITDALIMQGVSKFYEPGEIELKALLAGNDLLLCPTNVPKAVKFIKEALAAGTLSIKELDAHVLRILEAKEKILKVDGFKNTIDDQDLSRLFTTEGFNIKKQLYTQAITLCGNIKDLPPAGVDLALIEVKGSGEENFKKILEKKFKLTNQIALEKNIDEKTCLELIERLKDSDRIALSIYHISSTDHQTYGIDPQILCLVNQLKSQGKQVIITLFGTPYCLKLFNQQQTIILGYENDPDAYEAAAKVLCGQCEGKGQLPVVDRRFSEPV